MAPTEIKHKETCTCEACASKLYLKVLNGGDNPPETKDTPKEELFGF